MVLRESELEKALELDFEMGGSRRRVYHSLAGHYKGTGTSPRIWGDFEERDDDKGHITYHRIKK